MTNKSKMPEWVTEKQSRGITHRDLTQVIEALQIAWEALVLAEIESRGTASHDCYEDVMRRIEELGK